MIVKKDNLILLEGSDAIRHALLDERTEAETLHE